MANRLHYLDWLHLTAIPGVLLRQTNHPSDLTDWHLKNSQLSPPFSAFLLYSASWRTGFLFLAARAGKELTLRHRTLRQHVNERTKRLSVPHLFGCLLLIPILRRLEWTQRIPTPLFGNSFQESVIKSPLPICAEISGWNECCQWSFAFRFSFSLLALPISVQSS